MTERGVPPIDPGDLRDPATDDRVERIWSRVEADLARAEPSVSARGRLAATVLAATLCAFGGGVFVGKALEVDQKAPLATVSAVPSENATATDVFAAGTHGRTFPLPGGGQITLSPGATVEMVRNVGNALELRLVQGEASVNTNGVSTTQLLSIVAGEAAVAAQGGSVVQVRRNADDIDVLVTNGGATVLSPSGAQQLVSGERVHAVPIRTRTSTRPPIRVVRPTGSVAVVAVEEPPVAEPAPPAAAVVPDWRKLSAGGDVDGAYELLLAQPGGVDTAISSAQSPQELMDIHDVVARRQPSARLKVLSRIADEYAESEHAPYAAFKLHDIYRRAGQPERAEHYLEKVRSVKLLAEQALCKRFRTDENKDEAVRAAQEYLNKYPDGACKDEAGLVVRGEEADDEEDEPAAKENEEPSAP